MRSTLTGFGGTKRQCQDDSIVAKAGLESGLVFSSWNVVLVARAGVDPGTDLQGSVGMAGTRRGKDD